MADTTFSGVLGYLLLRWRVTFLLMIGLALAGLITVLTLPRESTPEVQIPFASVLTVYPGASARDVEELVTDVIEERVENLAGVKEITSSSQLGISSVAVEFEANEDVEEAVRRLREAIDGVTGLPQNAEDPQVIEISFDAEPILTIGLGGIEDERLLTLYAQDLADDLQTIPGVADVRVVGAREQVVRVLLDPERLARYGVSLGQITATLQAVNINFPIGQIATEGFAYDVRLQGRFSSAADVAAVQIPLPTGGSVPLDQIGTVELALAEVQSRARMSVEGRPSTAAVSLQITKKTGGNIIDIVDVVTERVEQARTQTLPAEITIAPFADRADEIRRSLDDVTSSGLQTFVIVLVILWLFLGWREALIAAVAVPLTFAISFLLFEAAGITLNSISLFSLILSLGLLVDNSIVVVEGIHRGVGKPHLREHAMDMVRRFQKPLIGGTLTTVAAFVPMLLVSGIIGEFIRTIPIVLSATLLSSLFVSLGFIPVVAVQTLSGRSVPTGDRRFEQYFQRFQAWYSDRLGRLLDSRRAQNIFIWSLVALLIVGLSLPFLGVLRTGLFPEVDIDFMIVNVELPPGSVLEQTAQVMTAVENILQQEPAVASYVANIGASSSIDLGGGSSSEHLGSLSINLDKARDVTSIELTRKLRDKFSAITEADVTITEISAGPPTASPIELRVIGPNLDELATLSQQIMEELETLPGAVDVDRNLRFSAGEFTFTLDPALVAEHGLTTRDVGIALRNYVFGSEVTSFLGVDGREISVRLQAPAASVDSVSDLLAVPFMTVAGQTVYVGQVATVELNTSINTIRRQGGERSISISAKSDGTRTPNEISVELQERLAVQQLPDGYRVEFGGEQQETEETFSDLYRSMIVAIILILIILVVEFDSFVQPLLIFLSIPLALIGVLFGLMLLGGQLNFAAFIGLVSLTGIVVNNAIILVDRMNQVRGTGVTAMESVKQAVATRLRPVLLTTLTTVLGVVPLIWVDEFFRDLALTLVTGLIFSTVLTLVFIPVLYLRLEQRRVKKLSLPA